MSNGLNLFPGAALLVQAMAESLPCEAFTARERVAATNASLGEHEGNRRQRRAAQAKARRA